MGPKFSIVIPARDEESYLPLCLDAIDRAAEPFPDQVEVVVVINRCTDRSEEIARSRGAVIVHDESKCLSKIRNAGVRAATGEILITIDADSAMAPEMLTDVDRQLGTGKVIGGGTLFTFDRPSFGLLLLLAVVMPLLLLFRIAAGCFWCLRSDFLELGGFDESLFCWEDVDFAVRLKRHGKKKGKRFKILVRSRIRTSARKFSLLKSAPRLVIPLLRGVDEEAADKLWYETPREESRTAHEDDAEDVDDG